MSNMVVRTNVFALNAHRNMKNVGMEQGRASNRLSSGFRINSAADDAAGLAISETMRAQIRGLDQASRNAQDGQAMLLTTEGGLDEIGNMLQRTRELLVQAANDTNTQGQRDMIRQEIGQLSQEIASMQNRVEFNTNRVLAMGPAMDSEVINDTRLLSADNLVVSEAFNAINANRALVSEAREALRAMDQLMTVAAGGTENPNLSARMLSLLDRTFNGIAFSQGGTPHVVGAPGALAGVTANGFNNSIFTLSVGGTAGVVVNRTGADGAGGVGLAQTLLSMGVSFNAAGQSADGGISGFVADYGTLGTNSGVTMSIGVAFNWQNMNATGVDVNVTDLITALNARDTLLDGMVDHLNSVRADMLDDTLDLYADIHAFRNEPSSGNNVAWFQVGANSAQGIQFDFENVSRAVSAASQIVQVASIMVANPNNGGGIGSGVDVSPLVNMIQSSLDDVNSIRANLGAVQNRMDYTMRSLDISSENLQDSESRVRNADVAREMMRFTMSNVLQQAAVSMLSQANQLPNNLLQLLR